LRVARGAHFHGIELRSGTIRTDALRGGSFVEVVGEDAHQQRAIKGMSRLDEGGEPLVRGGQRAHGHVLATDPWVGDELGGGEALRRVLPSHVRSGHVHVRSGRVRFMFMSGQVMSAHVRFMFMSGHVMSGQVR
jgi:hypothetical protein